MRYAAADAFYYDTVARNIVHGGRISYDGVHTTNGFHPLWQAIVAVVYLACELLGMSEPRFLVVVMSVCFGLIAVSLWLAARAFVEAEGYLPISFLIFPVGAYGLVLAPFWWTAMSRGLVANAIEGPPQLFGTMFSFINGMESAVAICVFSLVARRSARDDPTRSPANDGLLLALLVLFRLDLVFVACAVLAWLSIRPHGRIFSRLFAFAAPIGGYLGINRAYSGMFLPVSGTTKSTFPHLAASNARNVASFMQGLLPDVDGFFRFWRVAQIVVPAAVFIVVVTTIGRRRPMDRLEQFIVASGVWSRSRCTTSVSSRTMHKGTGTSQCRSSGCHSRGSPC